MQPVRLLKDNNVAAVVVLGIGAQPLQGFADAGISVFQADRSAFQDVRSVVDGVLEKKLPLMDPASACRGHGKCHGHGKDEPKLP